MRKMKFSARQGDILVLGVEELPEDLKAVPRDNGRVVLAYGEQTGHHHSIAESGAELLEGIGLEHRFLQVLEEGGVSLTHQEHSAILLPEGNYQVIRQREYQPEAIKYVAD